MKSFPRWSYLLHWLLLGVALPNLFAAPPAESPIALENFERGTSSWILTRPSPDALGEEWHEATGPMLAYASAPSAPSGGTLDFFVSTYPAQRYRLKVYRLGWYHGSGGRLLYRSKALTGKPQPVCPLEPTSGRVECRWSLSYRLPIRSSWTPGMYIAVFSNRQRFQWRVVFVVRDDKRHADVLYQQPVLTYQAYADYPTGRGKSLYENHAGPGDTVSGTPRAVKVSLARPIRDGLGQGVGDDLWEAYLVRWLEKKGYDVAYTTDLDVHRGTTRLTHYKAVLIPGHSEYWTREMRDRITEARDAGVHLAFLGANAMFFQVRLEPSSDGTADRTLVGYKDARLDPIADPALKTLQWRKVGQPEQRLIGVQYSGWNNGAAAYAQPFVAQNTWHWLYEGTGLHDGDHIERIVADEIDRRFPEALGPPALRGTDTVLGASPFVRFDGKRDLAQTTIYQAPSGAWVFASGTMAWSWGLSRDGIANRAIQRMTANLLHRFLSK
jgi:hypothetical protein